MIACESGSKSYFPFCKTEGMWGAIAVDEGKPSLVLVSRDAGDVHVYRHGRCSVAISAAGGLEALQFVQCFVEAALYAGLVTGELGEGVRAVAVPYEGQTELRRVRIPPRPRRIPE